MKNGYENSLKLPSIKREKSNTQNYLNLTNSYFI